MAKQYRWRATTTYNSDTSLSYGVSPSSSSSWQNADIGDTVNGSWTYWYRDANVAVSGAYTDANSSRLAFMVTQTWSTSVDSRNNLTVTITTAISNVVRDDIRGYNQDLPGRAINFYESQGGASVLSLTDTQVATAHTLYAGPLTLATRSFTIAPGENLVRPSLYLHNQTIGYPSFDDIWVGVQFMNPLPKETVPHAVLNASGQWLSHNRTGGDLRIWKGSKWTNNLADAGGGEDSGDPPAFYRGGKWVNARTFGKE